MWYRIAYQRLEFKFTWPKEESIASAAAFKASDGWSPELEARLEGVGTGEGRRNWEAVEPLPSQDEMAMHDLTLFVDSLNEQEKAVLAIDFGSLQTKTADFTKTQERYYLWNL
jgi:hypothetical protein